VSPNYFWLMMLLLLLFLNYHYFYFIVLHRFDSHNHRMVVHTIGSIIRSKFEEPEPSWTKFSKSQRNTWFDIFKVTNNKHFEFYLCSLNHRMNHRIHLIFVATFLSGLNWFPFQHSCLLFFKPR